MNVFLATAKNGELDFGSEVNRARLRDFLKKKEGKTFRLELPKSKRTGAQNNFYHFYLGVIEQETGNSADDLHYLFRSTLLPKKTVVVRGRMKEHIMERPASTTELSITEFGEYLDKICAMTGIPIPDPQAAGYISNH